jgi:hypothetical protein
MCGIEQPLNAHANGVNGDSPRCNLGFPRPYRPRPNGADGGIVDSLRRRHADVPCAPLGRGWFWGRGPRVAPWAITVGPFGAARRNAAEGDSPRSNLGFPRPYRACGNGADGGIVDSLRRCHADVPCAPLGRGWFWGRGPRVAPWAITVGPFGAARPNAAEGDNPRCNLGYRSSIIPLALKGPHNAALQFAEPEKREQAINANLRGLGYGR